MAEPAARIRAYEPKDEKPVRFMVGQAHMEPLAYANNAMYFHPITLAIWIAVSSVFAQVMGWWPESGHAFFGYLRILPAFFAPAVPIMFFIDWRNRPDVEERAEKILRRPDFHDIQSYYSRSPASGFWLLEYGEDRLIGLIAVDASPNATSDEVVTSGLSDTERNKLLSSKGTSPVATVRHFFVEEGFRPAMIENDLLQFAIARTFEAGDAVQTIRMAESSLRPHIVQCLKKNGFEKGEAIATIGIASWALDWWELQRAKWLEAVAKL
ncbi:hypothetical protein DENSPDRAFT_380920 [Dentipellis sp. KUC8613]|nr:hypothetical protein DENSPDRAFT_380920 [Dentipellis sp. KUC8613]